MTKYYIEREANLKKMLTSEWIYYNPPDAKQITGSLSMMTYEQVIVWCPPCKNSKTFKERYVELIIPENVEKKIYKRQNLFKFGEDVCDIYYKGLKIIKEQIIWSYEPISLDSNFDEDLDLNHGKSSDKDEKMDGD